MNQWVNGSIPEGLSRYTLFQYRRTTSYADSPGDSFVHLYRREKTSKAGWLAVAATTLVVGVICGCGGGSSPSKVVYAVGLGSPNVAIFTISGSGGLSPVTSVNTGSGPDAIAIDPGHRFAYIVDSAGGVGPGGVSQYILDSKSGFLTAATISTNNGTAPPAAPAETGTNPVAMVIDVTGTYAFVANQGSNSISVFLINVTGCAGVCGDGTLTEVKQPAPGPVPPNCVAGSPVPCPLSIASAPTGLATTGKMLFVATSAGSVSTYTFDSTTGVVATPAAFTTAVALNPSAMTMDASGKFLFLTDSVASEVEVLSISSSGQLTPVSQSAPCALNTCATGPTPLNAWVSPSGNFLYTANQGGAGCANGGVSAFSVSSSGALTALSGSPFAAGPCPSYVATDSSSSLLFVANGGNNNTITVFSIDSSGVPKEPGTSSPSVVVNPVALASIN
jgi:6-phosphogluconolactonase (cycloisomerase 2 family)